MDIIEVATRHRRGRRRKRRHPVLRRRAVKAPAKAPVKAPVKAPAKVVKPTTPAPRVVTSPVVSGLGALPAFDKHLLRRFSSGLTPALAAQSVAAGGARGWFERQLDAASVPDPRGDEIDSWFDFHNRTPQEVFQRWKNGTEGFWLVLPNMVRWTVARRLESSRQVHEQMVDFWSNHLNVPVIKEDPCFARVQYDKVIRANALGTFEQLLQATIVHPAMVVNLNGNDSTKKAPNENLGRELLELHTVGVDGGYTEDDVKAAARLLTGYRVDVWWNFLVEYRTDWHDTNPVKVMGFSHQNSSSDGRAATLQLLSYLARHPKTARRLARKLCVRFVSDTPSESIISAVATAYLDNGTAITPMLRALVAHPDFAASQRSKLRTPQEDWQATVRALGITLQKPRSNSSFVTAMYYQFNPLGSSPYAWPAPDGYPDVSSAWASAGRMMNSLTFHKTLTAHYWPRDDAVLPELINLLPEVPGTLQQMVNTLSVAVLGELPTAEVSDAVATALGWSLNRNVLAWEAKNYWTVPTIVATLLDSPLHLYR